MIKQIFYSILVLAFACCFVSCGNKKNQEKGKASPVVVTTADSVGIKTAKKDLLSTDSTFSAYSVRSGSTEAFTSYIADDGVVLRPNHQPVAGKDSILALLGKRKAKNVTMSWTPLFADVAKSCDMGYTYGTYELSGTGPKGNPVYGNGTYVSIWKKDKSGKWKLALDSGNEGLNPAKKKNPNKVQKKK